MKPIIFLFVILLAVVGFITFTRREEVSPNPSTIPSETLSSAFNEQATDKGCSGTPTPAQTEGPYYKAGSPQRNTIADGESGEKLLVTGFVFDKNCQPIPNAWLDFWQANAEGVYDNEGFVLRGHQFTDENGMYQLETIVPRAYESRPPHIHVKVRAGDGPILTSQLYFPDPPAGGQNQTDTIFNSALMMNIQESESGKVGQFNFVLN